MKFRINVKPWLIAAGSITAGVAAIYFLDPRYGGQRRTWVADQFRRSGSRLQRQASEIWNHASAEATQLPRRVHKMADRVLEHKVRHQLAQLRNAADEIDVKVDQGRVYLRGWATPRVVRKLMKQTRVLGAEVQNQLALR